MPVYSIEENVYSSDKDGNELNILDTLKSNKDEANLITNKIVLNKIINSLEKREKVHYQPKKRRKRKMESERRKSSFFMCISCVYHAHGMKRTYLVNSLRKSLKKPCIFKEKPLDTSGTV